MTDSISSKMVFILIGIIFVVILLSIIENTKNQQQQVTTLGGLFNSSYNNRLALNLSNPENKNHEFEVITANITGLTNIGGLCQNATLTFGNASVNETNVKFEVISNTTNSCNIRFIFNTQANQNGNITSAYFYYNNSANILSFSSRFGKLTYFEDRFDYPTWNNTRWGQGTASGTTLNTTEQVAQILGNGIDFNVNFYNNKTNVNFTRPLSLFLAFKVFGGGNIDMGLDNGTTVATDYTDVDFKGDLFQSALDLHYEGGNELYNSALSLTDNVWYSYQVNANATSICDKCGTYFFFNHTETSLTNSSNVTGSGFLENVKFDGSTGLKQFDNVTIINGTARFYLNKAITYLSVRESNQLTTSTATFGIGTVVILSLIQVIIVIVSIVAILKLIQTIAE